ncbi:MAG: hypothetical protein MSH41_01885 [Bacteroidales bacterium]|nr:hypothetical protein [Bacteroidales bacterium]
MKGWKMKRCNCFLVVVGLALCLLSGCSAAMPWDDAESTAAVMTMRQMPDVGLCFVSDDSLVYVQSDAKVLSNTLLGHRCYVEYWSMIEQSDGTYLIEVSFVYPARELPVLQNDTVSCVASVGEGVGVPAAWCSGHYLNMVLEYYGSNRVSHDFWLVASDTTVGAEATLLLELYHDAGNDAGKLLQWEVVSYDIASLLNARDVDMLQIVYRQYDMTDSSVTVALP